MKTFNGDIDLKAKLVQRAADHQRFDDYIHGTYMTAMPDGGMKGCAVGCLSTEVTHTGEPIREKRNCYVAIIEDFKIPYPVLHVAEHCFERWSEDRVLNTYQPSPGAAQFPQRFVEAMPVGYQFTVDDYQSLSALEHLDLKGEANGADNPDEWNIYCSNTMITPDAADEYLHWLASKPSHDRETPNEKHLMAPIEKFLDRVRV
jgi:hypothetical protein